MSEPKGESIPAILNPGQLIHAAARSADSAARALSVGQMLEATVLERQVETENGPVLTKGIQCGGKFVPVDLPPDVQAGDRIRVRVIQDGANPALVFVSKVEESDKQAASSDAMLKIILQKLNLTQAAVESLKSLLIVDKHSGLNQPHEAVLKEALYDFLSANKIPLDGSFKDPARLSAELAGFNPPAILQAVKDAKERALSLARESFLPRHFELLRQVEKCLEELISAEPGAAEAPVQSGAQSAVARLFQVLREFGAKGGEFILEGERKLAALLGVQLDILKVFEARVEKLLNAPAREDSLETLARFLGEVDCMPLAHDRQLELEFKQFIGELRKNLLALLELRASAGELRELLSKALERLYKDFGLVDLENRVQDPAEQRTISRAGLPDKYVNILRSLEIQLKTILSFLDSTETPRPYQADPARAHDVSHLLKPIDEILKALPSPAEQGMSEAEKVFLAITQSLKEDLRLALEAKNPEDLKSVLRAALQVLQRTFGEILEENNAAALPPYGRPLGQELSGATRETLRTLALLIAAARDGTDFPPAECAEAPGRSGGGLRTEAAPFAQKGFAPDRVALVRMNTVDALRLLLSELRLALTDTAVGLLEKELFQISGQLMRHLDRDPAASLLATREVLRKSLEIIQRKFLGERASNSIDFASAPDVRSLLKLENIITGHETLRQLNPVMQAAGEPAMLIFPFLMHGLLSKIEMRRYSSPFVRGDGRQDDGGAAGNKGGGYERVQIQVSLPHLGGVCVDLARKAGEVLLRLSFESEPISCFVCDRKELLARVLREGGYQQVEIDVAAHGPGSAAKNVAGSAGPPDGLIFA